MNGLKYVKLLHEKFFIHMTVHNTFILCMMEHLLLHLS